ILHTTENLYQYLVALTKAVLIDHKNPAPENTPILNNLVVTLEAFCNDFQITTPLNKGIFAKKSDPKADFQELLSILTGGKITKGDTELLIAVDTDRRENHERRHRIADKRIDIGGRRP
nr:hypothetical protein [Cytophagales bacterium]